MYNQDWALAEWRKAVEKYDPALYTTEHMFGSVCVWVNIAGTVGWFRPQIVDGILVGIRPISYPAPSDAETPKDKKVFDWFTPLTSPKQRNKIIIAYESLLQK